MDFSKAGTQIIDLLKSEGVAALKDAKVNSQELATYVAERTAVLAGAVGQAGYSDALVAERDNIVLKTAGKAIDEGDAFDMKIAGIVTGALHIAVTAL